MTGPLAMFPLGQVLLPGMPIALRVFEPRFLAMLAEVSAEGEPEFGVVLIDRGHEVGGEDTRFDHATVARLAQVEPDDGAVGIVAVGGRRVRVDRWLADDPYPMAEVETLVDLEWDESLRPRLDETVETVLQAREVLRPGGEPVPLEADPVTVAWRLAAAAPVGPLDRLAALRAPTVEALLTTIRDTTAQVLLLHEAFDG